jgi:Tol biopolymer transport system component
VYDVGTHRGTPYLVNELLEGVTLREQLSESPLPIRKAIAYAVQIAHGLAAAHEKGIVHRDLKPENIFVTDDGRVKILDFGLAKLAQPEPSLAGVSTLPTTPPNTAAGTILGTMGYMAPEQVRGVPADHRSDLFAFGVVLYEMLSSRRAFQGETAMDTLAAIVKGDPPELPAVERRIPPGLVRIVHRCLEKSPAARFQSTRDLAFALEALSTPSTTSGATEALVGEAGPPRGRDRTAWTVAAALGAVALASVISAVAVYRRPTAVEQQPIQFTVSPPDGWSTRQSNGASRDLALSPDGRRLAFIAADTDGRTRVWVRSLDSTVAQSVKGTEGASRAFWSPDGKFLAFTADRKLKKIDVAGGPPQTITDSGPTGGAWNRDGTILFNATGNSSLSSVSATGGSARLLTTLDQGEVRHVNPHFLPDGQHFLYGTFPSPSIYLSALNSKDRTQLLTDVGAMAKYSQSRLFFTRASTLMAQEFDTAALKLVGEPLPIAEIPGGVFDVSTSGILAYQGGMDVAQSRLAWFDRTGNPLGVLGEAANYANIEISPDGSRAVGGIREKVTGGANTDVWLYNLDGSGRTRLTFDTANTTGRVIWAPDGKRLVYSKKPNASGVLGLFQKAMDGLGDEQPVLEARTNALASSWSPDGTFLFYMAVPGSPTTGNDLWILPLAGDRKPYAYLETTSNEFGAQFAPNSRWVAYSSNESGRSEVYVAAFHGARGKRLISTAGGSFPRWRKRDGKELYYLAPNNVLMAAAVNGDGPSFEVTAVKTLFETRAYGDFPYDVSADGQRFLIVTASAPSAAGITVALNWSAGTKK